MTTMETPDNIEQIRALEKLAEDWLDKNPPEDFDATTLQRLMIGFHQSIAPQTYRMSKDYEALYDILCKGGEVLGRISHPFVGMDNRFQDTVGTSIRVCEDHICFDRKDGTYAGGMDKNLFVAECAHLDLEWLAPSKTLTDEEIDLIVDLNRTKVEYMDLDSTQSEDEERIYQNGRIDGIKEGLEIARDNDYLAPQEKVVRIEPQPKWQEDPKQDDDGSWCGRYQCMVVSRSGEPDVDVDVDVVFPPSQDVMPVELEKVWYWVPHDTAKFNLAPELQ